MQEIGLAWAAGLAEVSHFIAGEASSSASLRGSLPMFFSNLGEQVLLIRPPWKTFEF